MRPILVLSFLLARLLCAEPVILGGPDFTGALQPQVAIGENGQVHLVFGRKDGSILHSLSTDGRVYQTPVKIGSLPKLALGMHRGPRVAMADGTILVSAISHESGDLVTWTSSDGRTWKGPMTVNSVPRAAREGLHAMAAFHSRAVLCWLDDRNGKKELRGAVSKDGGASWEADTLIYHSPDGSICACCAPSLAFGPKGELAVMWRNDLGGSRDLHLALSSDGGQTFGPANKLGTGTWKLKACPMDGGGLTYLPSDPAKPLTLWRRETVIHLAPPEGAEDRVGEGKDPAIAGLKRGAVIAWQAPAGLTLRLPGEPARMLDALGRSVTLAADPNGTFAVAIWESGTPEGGLKVEVIR